MVSEVYFDNIGKVRITKKRGIKNITLTVKEGGEIRMTIPYSVSFRHAENFIKEKSDRILKMKQKIAEKEKKRTLFTPETEFKTKKHKLIFIPDKDKTFIKISKSFIKVYYSEGTDFKNENFQEYIRKGITETLRVEAKEYLPERTKLLAYKHGFNTGKVSVRNAKTRWGSCSAKNNISLNIHLMRLPEHLSDYVILHELCHTVEKNHGKNFWALLDKVSGNAKKYDKELKNYSPNIF